ncbi:MAG: alkaline phosphatase family protein [Chitinophagales bacterium]|nr:alkaline phosphatase family protein [Chitinophagales bacterium]
MKRRDFIKAAGIAAAGSFIVPYILPSGRLFAASGSRIANHVIFCLFAGGVRNIESMHFGDGNLMPYTLPGNDPISASIAGSMSNLPAPSGQPLLKYGTLFKEFRYKQGSTGHTRAHQTAITGNYAINDNALNNRPVTPTVFEYYRKHSSPTKQAMSAWWVSNQLGPYPNLNYSSHPDYGALYGANYIQPYSILSTSYSNPLVLSDLDRSKTAGLRDFCDNNFSGNYVSGDAGVTNTPDDAKLIESFINRSVAEAQAGQYNSFWGVNANVINNDMLNVYFAEKIIEEFQPELLVVNMTDIDTCHQNFTRYCDNIRKADLALAQLWNTIQSTPGMANDTILIAAPEHGRNLQPNTIADQNGRYALDHTGDDTSREIFCLVLGPLGKVNQNQTIATQVGESIDIVPTMATILGFNTEIPSGLLPGRHLEEAFV